MTNQKLVQPAWLTKSLSSLLDQPKASPALISSAEQIKLVKLAELHVTLN